MLGLPKKEEVQPVAAPERELTEVEDLVSWRCFQLLEAGYDIDAAQRIAPELRIDLHKACELVEAGCPIKTALEILL